MGPKQSVHSIIGSARSGDASYLSLHVGPSGRRSWEKNALSYRDLEEILVGAARDGHTAIVRALRGACDVNSTAVPWGGPDTKIHSFYHSLFGTKASEQEQEAVQMPPLLAALKGGHTETVAALLDHPRASLTGWSDGNGRSYLHIVAEEAGTVWEIKPWTSPAGAGGQVLQEGRVYMRGCDLLAMLLRFATVECADEEGGVEHWVNSRDSQGRTVLGIAASRGDADAVATLLRHGASLNQEGSEESERDTLSRKIASLRCRSSGVIWGPIEAAA